jgi:aminoglycoside phosphotransferase (APT) family kinase protein
MSAALEFLKRLRDDGCVRSADARLSPLGGGVSSEIYLVHDGDDRFVVKRALARLKVEVEWYADVARNRTEQQCLACVATILPGAVPAIRFADPDAGYFAMEYLGGDWANWKQLLLNGICDPAHARMAGRVLGEIHRQTEDRPELREKFDTSVNFHQLRTAPYLLTTGERHPALRDAFIREAQRLMETRECLVHGDFSPKNILIKDQRLILLDCEVAWYGDPSFDVAFLLNHFFLKGLYHAPRRPGLEAMIPAFWQSYCARRPASRAIMERRVVQLLPLLMLARVDGKSPVEYLAAGRKEWVRRFVTRRLAGAGVDLETITRDWFDEAGSLPPAEAET